MQHDRSKGQNPTMPSRTAIEKLDAKGVDWVCDAIMDRTSLTAIALEAGVAVSGLLKWIDADEERSARVRSARAAMAKIWDEQSEQVIADAPDEFGLKKARELAHHYRWRASKIAPPEYGDRQHVEHSGKLGIEQLIAGDGDEA